MRNVQPKHRSFWLQEVAGEARMLPASKVPSRPTSRFVAPENYGLTPVTFAAHLFGAVDAEPAFL